VRDELRRPPTRRNRFRHNARRCDLFLWSD
jgi:hypothetical protein